MAATTDAMERLLVNILDEARNLCRRRSPCPGCWLKAIRLTLRNG